MKLFSYLSQLYNNRKTKTDRKGTFLGTVLNRINNSQQLSPEQMNNLLVLLFAYVIVFPELLERELKKCSIETLQTISQLLNLKVQATREVDTLFAKIESQLLQLLKKDKVLYAHQETSQWALFLAYCDKYEGNIIRAINEFMKFMNSLNVPILDKVMSMLDVLNKYANNSEIVNSILNMIRENTLLDIIKEKEKESVQKQDIQKQEESCITMSLQPSPAPKITT